jgi:hypothetical protein
MRSLGMKRGGVHRKKTSKIGFGQTLMHAYVVPEAHEVPMEPEPEAELAEPESDWGSEDEEIEEKTGVWHQDGAPTCMDEVVLENNNAVNIKTLVNQLNSVAVGVNTRLHVIEMFGSSGTGKSTVARLLAKECGCEFREVSLADLMMTNRKVQEEMHSEVTAFVSFKRNGPPCFVLLSGCEILGKMKGSSLENVFLATEKMFIEDSNSGLGRGVVVFEHTKCFHKGNRSMRANIGFGDVSELNFAVAVKSTLQRLHVPEPPGELITRVFHQASSDVRLGLNMLQWMWSLKNSWEGCGGGCMPKCDDRQDTFDLLQEVCLSKSTEKWTERCSNVFGTSDFMINLMHENVHTTIMNRSCYAPVSTAARCLETISDADFMMRANMWSDLGISDAPNMAGVALPGLIAQQTSGNHILNFHPKMTKVLNTSSQESTNRKAKMKSFIVGPEHNCFTHKSHTLDSLDMCGGRAVAEWSPLLEFIRMQPPGGKFRRRDETEIITGRQLTPHVNALVQNKHNDIYNKKAPEVTVKTSRGQTSWVKTAFNAYFPA